MNPFRKLIGDTAIYGASSIMGRFLNWWLVPYYSVIFLTDEYGIVANLYAYVAFLLIILTYGMETGYFRFASKSDHPHRVYSTSQTMLLFTTAIFMLGVALFRHDISGWIRYPQHPEYIVILAAVVSIDAFTSIPFAKMRLDNRPVRFAGIKLIHIGLNIGFNLFFLSLCPILASRFPDSPVTLIYSPDIGVGYVFIANLLASLSTLILLRKEIWSMKILIDKALLKQMLNYSYPILIIGIAGMINQNIDKILIPFLVPENQLPMHQVGIYSANYKLAVLMNMFIQAFRYAFEPFFFSRNAEESPEDPMIYATVMKYFLLFGMLIFLGMTLYIDVVKLLIDSSYHEGIKVVPLVLMANLFFGIFFSLSIWFKLKDLTLYGAYIALIGAVITLVLNFLLIPAMGYMGSAIAVLACFFVMMVITYIWGQKHYYIPYDLKRMGLYFVTGLILYGVSQITAGFAPVFRYSANTAMLFFYVVLVIWLESREILQILKRNKG